MGSTLVFVTIGQAPRKDLSEAIEATLPPDVRVRHAGVLDGLERAEVQRRFGVPAGGSATLISRLADGEAVTLDAGAVADGLQRLIARLEAGVGEEGVGPDGAGASGGADVIVVLCTGEFPGLRARRVRLIEPDALVTAYVSTLLGGSAVGVVVPLPEQVAEAREKWRGLSPAPEFATASPYGDESRLVEAARALVDGGAGAVVLDCMGYADRHRLALRRAGVTVPVLTSGAMVGAWTGPLLR
ncbi:AroM family protein [Streptomyces sp. bgisy091]|uniref:AroM family protein n=1 Tax=Streptomyces sp. bgisy091 TaxID=3413778 RepID=UPI003D7028D7